MIGTIEKVPLQWPPLNESIHVHLESNFKRYDIYFDPAQGYLPVKLTIHLKVGHDAVGSFDPNNPRLGTVTAVLESKKVAKDKYFPMKVVILEPKNRSPDETGACDFLLFNVTKLDYDKEPSEEELSIPVPAGCLIGTDSGTEGPYIKFRRPENVKPSDLPKIISMLEKELESQMTTGQHAIQDTALKEPKSRWSRYLWWGVAALGLLTLFNLILFLVRKRTKEKTS